MGRESIVQILGVVVAVGTVLVLAFGIVYLISG